MALPKQSTTIENCNEDLLTKCDEIWQLTSTYPFKIVTSFLNSLISFRSIFFFSWKKYKDKFLCDTFSLFISMLSVLTKMNISRVIWNYDCIDNKNIFIVAKD